MIREAVSGAFMPLVLGHLNGMSVASCDHHGSRRMLQPRCE